MNKASRGELKNPLPVGLIYDTKNHVVLDPDQQVQQAIHTLFATFERTSSATATVKSFRQQGLLFPRRLRRSIRKGQLLWVPLVHHRVLQVLHNPRYAGAFFHGRVHTRKDENGCHLYTTLPMEEWHTLLPEAHPGYIPWEQYHATCSDCATMPTLMATIVAMVPPAKGRHSCKAWSCAASAANA